MRPKKHDPLLVVLSRGVALLASYLRCVLYPACGAQRPIARAVLTSVRSVSLELRPSLLDDLGLAAAVVWDSKRQGERAGYAVHVEETLGPSRLPEAEGMGSTTIRVRLALPVS